MAQYLNILKRYLSAKAEAQQTPLSAVEKLWHSFGDRCNKVVQQPIIGHGSPLDSFPDGCRDQPQWWDQEAQT